MDFFDVLMTRRSIRSFLPDPVSEEDIATLVKAGTMAPSAMNRQPWHFVVVTDREKLDAIADRHPHAAFARQAPLAIVVVATPAEASGDFWVQDCSAATENILLAARALGLGSVWCGLYPVQERADILADILSVPKEYVPLSLIVLGHTEKEFCEAHRHNEAKIHHNSW